MSISPSNALNPRAAGRYRDAHPPHRGATNRKRLGASGEGRRLLNHPVERGFCHGHAYPALPGQPQQVIPSHRGAFAAHIHVMLSHRSVAERQVECGRQSPTPILPETPCKVLRMIVLVVKQHVEDGTRIGLSTRAHRASTTGWPAARSCSPCCPACGNPPAAGPPGYARARACLVPGRSAPRQRRQAWTTDRTRRWLAPPGRNRGPARHTAVRRRIPPYARPAPETSPTRERRAHRRAC